MKKRVLIVDEDASFRSPLESALDNMGFESCSARDAFEAFKVVSSLAEKGQSPDLMVVAVQMNVVNGVELLDQLETHGHSPQVVFTSYFMDETLFAGLMRKQCVDFIEKPLSPTEASARVAEVLRTKGEDRLPSRAVFCRKNGEQMTVEWSRTALESGKRFAEREEMEECEG